MSLFLTRLILARLNAVDMGFAIRVASVAVHLASQAMIACSHSHAPATAVDMVSVPKQEAVRATTVGVALIAPLSSSVQEALQNALVMANAFPLESASALRATQGVLVKPVPQSVLRIALVTATAAKIRCAFATMVSLV